MLCPVHGTRLTLTESLKKGELLLCTPRGRKGKPHPVTVFYFQEGFQLEVPDSAVFEENEDEEGKNNT